LDGKDGLSKCHDEEQTACAVDNGLQEHVQALCLEARDDRPELALGVSHVEVVPLREEDVSPGECGDEA